MANQNIQQFLKVQKATFERCLHSSMDCEEEPIRAHSIQNSRVIDLIQTNGHVMMPGYRLVNGEPQMDFLKVGRNAASTFTGLCSKHDNELFKAIDTEPFKYDKGEHRRQLAYRSVMREFHTELECAERFHTLHRERCKAEGKDPDKTETPALHLWAGWMKKSQRVYVYRRKHFDKLEEEGELPELRHLIITMDDQAPVLACSSLFSTGFTGDGAIIGPTLNVLPLGLKFSVALLSYPVEQEAEIKKVLAKLFEADEKTLKYELAKVILGYVENFTISPAHYDKWSNDRRARVLREYLKPPGEVEDHPDLNIFL